MSVTIKKDSDFTKGYICAVCVCISMEGGVSTTIKELFKSGVGNITYAELKKIGIDEYDLHTLRMYRKELGI